MKKKDSKLKYLVSMVCSVILLGTLSLDAFSQDYYLDYRSGLQLTESKPIFNSFIQLATFQSLEFKGNVASDTDVDSCKFSFWLGTSDTSCDLQMELFLDPDGSNTLVSSTQFTITESTYIQFTSDESALIGSLSSGSDLVLKITSAERCAAIGFDNGKEPHISLSTNNSATFNWEMFLPAITAKPTDCNGDLRGGASLDNCGKCVEGNTSRVACTQDCKGDWGGSAVVDVCGICGGSGAPCPQCTLTCSSTGFNYTCGTNSSTSTKSFCYLGYRQYVESASYKYTNGHTVTCSSQYCGGPLTCSDDTGQSCIVQ